FTGYISGLTAYGSVSPSPSPQPNPQTSIWDSCQSLSGSGFVWISSPSTISLSVDTSVKSPLGTGSIKSTVPSGTTSDSYVVERFSADASALKDFTVGRPSSVYVQGSRAVTWRVEVVTREGGGWNIHVIAQKAVPANTMTVISLDYSAISNSALQKAAQVSIIALVNQQSFTGYISGLTAYGSVSPSPSPQPTPQPTPQPNPQPNPQPSGGLHVSGSRILDATNTQVALRGIGSFEMSWGPWNTGSMTSCLSFLHSQRLNFLRMFVRANLVLNGGSGFIQAIHDLCNIAKSNGVYVEFVFDGLVQGGGQGGSGTPIPYSPYIVSGDSSAFPNTAAFNRAVSILASTLSSHSNALLGIWNEPTYPDYNAYNVYFAEMANSIQTARNAGFNCIVVVNLWTAFTPGAGMSGLSHGNGDMTFAIDHKSLFTNYGSVVADFHSYHCYLNQWGTYPDDYSQLRNLWLYTGRISEAQNNGICVAYFEGGVRVTSGNVNQQIAAYSNALRICNENGISWSGWCWSSSDSFAALSNMNPPRWNSAGQVLANYA
ncbi:glycoside hydrolase family 5 protein, partial [Candidatus Bathyarchaeota archaeon]|nr:glycoside hydrolase family 5 protein [Candidatus Bathyarchaeota archaeon]